MQHIKFFYGQDPTSQGFFWPASDQKRSEWLATKRLRPMIAESVYQCNPGARQGVVFTDDDFDWYTPPMGLELGVNLPTIKTWMQASGGLVIQAWDTAFSATQDSDWTVCVTGMLVPCTVYHRGEDPLRLGECEPHYDVFVLDIYRDRIKYGDLLEAVRAQYMRWNPNMVIVEKKNYGVPIVEALENSGVPMEPVTPIDGKRARAVEGIGAGSAQGWFKLHRVKFPVGMAWIDTLTTEMKDFTGEKGNTDDQVDAMVHLVQYAIRSGGNSAPLPTGWKTTEDVDRQMQISAVDSPFGVLFNMESVDPFAETCGRCRNYVQVIRKENISTNHNVAVLPNDFCVFHRRKYPALASCDDFTDTDPTMLVLSRN